MKVLLPLLFACTTEGGRQGTVVGNPGDSAARLAPLGEGLSVDVARLQLGELWLDDCEGGVEEVQIGREVDLIADEVAWQIPAGTWCRFGLALASPLYLAGTGPEGHHFEVNPKGGWIELDSFDEGVVVDGGSYLFEMAEPGWLSVELLDLENQEEVVVDQNHPLIDAVSDQVAFHSALFRDPDADGTLAEEERAEGAIAVAAGRDQDLPASVDTGDEAGFDVETPEGGCGGGSAAMLLVGVGLWGRKRFGNASPA